MDTGRNTDANTTLHTARYTPPPGDDATTRTARIYAAVKQGLLLGEYTLGARLGEERLARELGASRTPVREALFRLHSEGLVHRHPDGGYCPAVPNIAAVRELYEVRIALERAALLRPRASARPHDRALLVALRDEWLAMAADPPAPHPEFVLWDEEYHVRLAESSGNHELAEMLRRVNERIRVVRMRDFLTHERMTKTIAEHLGVVAAVLDGDLDGAVATFEQHLRTSLDVVEQRVAGALLQMAVQR
ncbi:MAG TPA: GntR family transcriptional regulator [Acidimicrobiales bacterium]|nr:GntR family transcriptional regulator [Acidimicrobiales bacterium]